MSSCSPIVGAPEAFSVLSLGEEDDSDDCQDWLQEYELNGAPLAHAHEASIHRQGRHAAGTVYP